MRAAKLCPADREARAGHRAWFLKKKLCAQLNQAWRVSANDLTERRTADIAVDGLGSEELRVVENVKTFEPELKRLRFG